MAKKKKKATKKPEVEPNRTAQILQKIEGQSGGKAFGLQMMDSTKIEDIPRTPSGIFSLNLALGGGYPHGRIIEVFGPEGGGKTTLALHALAEAQRRGGTTALIDVEHAYDPTYGQRVGINHGAMMIAQPDSGEQSLQLVETLCDHLKAGDLIVIDSVANLTPQAELDGDMGDSHPGLLARLMSQAMRKLASKIDRSGVTVIFINQIRHKIGVMFGSPETTTGGNALRFYASQRVDVRYIGKLKEVDERGNPLGHRVRAKVVKNKVSPPFREVELDLYYGYGFLRAADVFAIGVKEKVIDQSGSYYSFQNEQLGQGKEKSKHFLASSPEMMDSIESAVMAKYGVITVTGE